MLAFKCSLAPVLLLFPAVLHALRWEHREDHQGPKSPGTADEDDEDSGPGGPSFDPDPGKPPVPVLSTPSAPGSPIDTQTTTYKPSRATTLIIPVTSVKASTSTTTFSSFSTIVIPLDFTPTPLSAPSSAPTSFLVPASAPGGSSSPAPTYTAPLPSSTDTSSNMMIGDTNSDDGANNRTLIITLSTVLSVIGLVVVSIAVYLFLRSRRRRMKLFNRGVTPIGDDEIATWKIDRNVNEKGEDRFTSRRSTASTSYTHQRRPSNGLIQYHNTARPSTETARTSIQSPRSFMRNQSFELPLQPQSVVLARAPNARSGLTDDMIPGDEPFVIPPKRQPSKLFKSPPTSPSATGHRPRGSRGSRSSSMRSFNETWYGDNTGGFSPRTSNDYYAPSYRPSRVYSTSNAPPRLSLGDHNEPLVATVLSPPPLHRDEIGRALG